MHGIGSKTWCLPGETSQGRTWKGRRQEEQPGAEKARDHAICCLGPVLTAWCPRPSQTWTILSQESPSGSFCPASPVLPPGSLTGPWEAGLGWGLCLLWVAEADLFLTRGECERRVCLYVCDRDRRQGRSPVSLPSSPFLGLSTESDPAGCIPSVLSPGRDQGGGGPGPTLLFCVLTTLPPSVQGPHHSGPQEETNCPSRHHVATALPQSLISVPGRPSQCTPGWTPSREDA